jgi:hypothetical protein
MDKVDIESSAHSRIEDSKPVARLLLILCGKLLKIEIC